MTHDEEMWQDYDYHRNTGELPEYFDEEQEECSDDGDYGGEGGLDYVPIRSKCPRCGSMSAKLLDDDTYSCLYCSANFYDGRLIKPVDMATINEKGVPSTPLYCIKCGSDNTEYYDNNTFHCLDCGCTTHPGASCPKCRRRFMELLPDNTWQCLSCGAKFTDDESIDNLQFKCHVYNIRHLAERNHEYLIKKYSRKHQLSQKPKDTKKK